MLRAGPAAPAASGPAAARATSSQARGEVYALAPTRSSARASAAPRVLGRRRDLPGLVLEDPFHLVDLFRRRPAGGQGGDGRLEDPPGFEELADGLALRRHHEGQRADQRVEGHLADEGALARTDLDEPQAFERSQGFAHGGAADDEFFGELPLGREPIAALEATFRDQLLDLADDLLVDPRRLDRSKLDGRVRRLTSRFPAPGLAHRDLRGSLGRGRDGGADPTTSRAP